MVQKRTMISTLDNPNVPTKHYSVDLNEEAFKSKWRLLGFYSSVAKERGIKSTKIAKTLNRLDKETNIKKIVKDIDKEIGSFVVFYYGIGDHDPEDDKRQLSSVKTSKKSTKPKIRKKKTSMESLESNLIEATE